MTARIGPLRQSVARRPVPPGPVTLTIDIRTGDVLPPSVTSRYQVDEHDGEDGEGGEDGKSGMGGAGGKGEVLGVAATGPDTLAFGLGGPDPVVLAELDGRYLSTEVATGFTGRVIGMYVTEGSAAFDWFDYRPTTTAPDRTS